MLFAVEPVDVPSGRPVFREYFDEMGPMESTILV